VGRGGDRANYDAALADLSVTEEFHGYPGLQLMVALRESLWLETPQPRLPCDSDWHRLADRSSVSNAGD